jgi:hypothetical protein
MEDTRITNVLGDANGIISDFSQGLNVYTRSLRNQVRGSCVPVLEGAELVISDSEIQLIRLSAALVGDAEYHIIRAYHHTSPGLIAFLIGLYEFVMKVIGVITTINQILVILTHETLAHWIDWLMPGFEADWKRLMNGISEVSRVLGWGVDGVMHLMNAVEVSASLYGTITNKSETWIDLEKWNRKKHLLMSFSYNLDLWEANPGEMLGKMSELWASRNYHEGMTTLKNWVDKLGDFGGKVEKVLGDVGSISKELLAIQDGMPAFIARHIPQGIWDGIGKVETTINNRILPALTDITDRLDELDGVLESQRQRAQELADKIAHPGDMLVEIDNLPSYARLDQLTKIDDITSRFLAEANETDYAAMQGDLREFSLIAAALSRSPAPLAFMELDLPGRSPGIRAEPRESWYVGDY